MTALTPWREELAAEFAWRFPGVAVKCNYIEISNWFADRLTAKPADEGVIAEIIAERRRQIKAEGYDAKHDDEHTRGEIARAAACYAYLAGAESDYLRQELKKEWWGPRHLQPTWPPLDERLWRLSLTEWRRQSFSPLHRLISGSA